MAALGKATAEEADGYRQLVGKKLRVKLGKSFRDRSNNAFHTISYDFKPKSIDSTKSKCLKVLKEGEVEVSIPNVQAETADDVTMFRGASVPTQKECLLMIDLDKGEAVLERITNKVNLKVVRSARKQQQRLQPVVKERPVSPSVPPPPKQGSQLQVPTSTATASGLSVAAKQSKGKQPRSKKRAVEGPSQSVSSSSNPPRPSQPKKAKVKRQPKVSEKKTTHAEPQKPTRQPSPPADIPQKRPFPPLSSPSSSDSDSGEEDGLEKNTLHALKECVQPPPDGGVVHQMMSGFPPHTAAASSSSSSDSDSSSDASSSEGEQVDGSQGITMATGERKQAPARSMSLLKNDLQLSSYSDSDSSS